MANEARNAAEQALHELVLHLEQEISARDNQKLLLVDEVRLLKKEVRQTQGTLKRLRGGASAG